MQGNNVTWPASGCVCWPVTGGVCSHIINEGMSQEEELFIVCLQLEPLPANMYVLLCVYMELWT
jgi:hypothetical protein